MDPIKLLLVDDEAEFRAATATALGRRGFEVRTAASGPEALALVDAELPDIVVLDLRMEGMDGIETLEQLRKRSRQLPVLILTGHGGFQEAVSGIRLEIADFLQKPVEVERLAARVRALLQRGGAPPLLRERTVAELMVPISAYRRLRGAQPVREALALLATEWAAPGAVAEEPGRRTLLVFDEHDRFLGCLRQSDLVALLVPAFLRHSPYASFFTGMFLAQAKVVGNEPVAELVRAEPSVSADAPLMEAVSLMVDARVINLPVLQGGDVVGLLRDQDLLREVAQIMGVAQRAPS